MYTFGDLIKQKGRPGELTYDLIHIQQRYQAIVPQAIPCVASVAEKDLQILTHLETFSRTRGNIMNAVQILLF